MALEKAMVPASQDDSQKVPLQAIKAAPFAPSFPPATFPSSFEALIPCPEHACVF